MFRKLFLKTPDHVDRKYRRMFAFLVWVLLYTILFIPWLGASWKLVISIPAIEIFTMVVMFVINDKVLVGILQKRYLTTYIMLVIIIVGFIAYFTGHIESIIVSQFDVAEPYKTHQFIIKNSVLMVYSVFVSTVTTLALRNYDDKEAHTKLLAEKNEMELKFLKMQINPHFLFNALNNIYSMSVTENKNSSEAIMRLSSMLRYILDNNSGYVSVNQEVEHLKNFIEFQNLCSEGEERVTFDSEIIDSAIKIPSMLLQPLVENCFKHSKNSEDGAIYISLKAYNGNVYFTTSNRTCNNVDKTILSGIGLQNVVSRLQLYYPNNFSLDSKQENSTFVVKLYIKTDV